MNTDSCKQLPGVFHPVIDRNRCEGKADCMVACPFSVFEVGILPKQQRKGLSLIGRIKGFAHGWKQAIVLKPNSCEACGLCIKACPEKAISLSRT